MTALGAAVTAVVAVGAALAAHAAAFVTVDGDHFVVGDQPFAFVGANLDVMHGQARERAEATIAAAAADGLTVGRIWALGEGDARSSAWSIEHQLFRIAPDRWLAAADRQLDHVLDAARRHGLRVIITLANHWDDYGGVHQYLSWAGLPAGGFGQHDAFFSDERTRAFYRAHLEHIVGRVNQVNGVAYADDPTIFAWELMNESQVETPAGAAARLQWIDEMARFIKARDRHHLVTPGLLGYTTRKERGDWLAACQLPAIDYCDSHLYPESTDRVASRARLDAYIDDRVQLAQHVAHKPLVLGEFGFQTDRAAWLGRPRAEWYGALLDRARWDGAAGALAWIYQPWSGHPRPFGIYVDRADTDDVRAVLRRRAPLAAARPAAANPRLGEAAGAQLLYNPYLVEARSPHQHLRDGALELTPSAYAGARWERLGSWGSGAEAHAYGAGDGWFEYLFDLPRPAQPTLAARLSSEWPGTQAPADGGSPVQVRVDDQLVTTIEVRPDDGRGRSETVALPRLQAGRHVLRLEVAPGPRANGLCVYGDERHPLRLTGIR